MLPDGRDKEEGFWHVVSRKDRDSGVRRYIWLMDIVTPNLIVAAQEAADIG